MEYFVSGLSTSSFMRLRQIHSFWKLLESGVCLGQSLLTLLFYNLKNVHKEVGGTGSVNSPHGCCSLEEVES